MYKNIINIWIGLAICAYAGKTNCTECRNYYNFYTFIHLKRRFLN